MALVSKSEPARLSRRQFISGVAALGGAALLGRRLLAQTATASSRRIIDVHHHIMPPFYIREHRRDQMKVGPGITSIFEWTPRLSIERMDAAGVATSMLSISTPGTWFGEIEEGRRLSRQVNEYSAKLCQDYPGRFGFFAAIPLADVDGSLKEIEYAFDALHADGVGIMTSYSSLPPGVKQFEPVFRELNRRRAIVFMHRTVPTCCFDLRTGTADKEFIIDDMRALSSLLTGGTLARNPDMTLIHAHGDKTLPWVAYHTAAGPPESGGGNPDWAPQGVAAQLQKVYVDTAGNTQDTMDDLRELGMMDRILFGSDNPYGGQNAVAGNLQRLRSFKLNPAELSVIERDNAVRLFPRFKA